MTDSPLTDDSPSPLGGYSPGAFSPGGFTPSGTFTNTAAERGDLRQQVERLTDDLQQARNALRDRRTQVSQLEAELSRLQDASQRSQETSASRIHVLENQLSQVEQTRMRLEQERDGLLRRVAERGDDARNRQHRLAARQKEISELEQRLENALRSLDQVQNENGLLVMEKKALLEEHQRQENELMEARELIRHLNGNLHVFSDKVRTAQRGAEEMRETLHQQQEQELGGLQEALDHTQHMLSRRDESLRVMKTALGEREAELATLKTGLQELDRLRNGVRDRDDRITGLIDEKELLLQRVERLEGAVREAQAEVSTAEVEAELRNRDEYITDLEEQLDDLKSRAIMAEQSAESKELEFQELLLAVKQYCGGDKDKEDLIQDVFDLRSRLQARNLEVEELIQELNWIYDLFHSLCGWVVDQGLELPSCFDLSQIVVGEESFKVLQSRQAPVAKSSPISEVDRKSEAVLPPSTDFDFEEALHRFQISEKERTSLVAQVEKLQGELNTQKAMYEGEIRFLQTQKASPSVDFESLADRFLSTQGKTGKLRALDELGEAGVFVLAKKLADAYATNDGLEEALLLMQQKADRLAKRIKTLAFKYACLLSSSAQAKSIASVVVQADGSMVISQAPTSTIEAAPFVVEDEAGKFIMDRYCVLRSVLLHVETRLKGLLQREKLLTDGIREELEALRGSYNAMLPLLEPEGGTPLSLQQHAIDQLVQGTESLVRLNATLAKNAEEAHAAATNILDLVGPVKDEPNVLLAVENRDLLRALTHFSKEYDDAPKVLVDNVDALAYRDELVTLRARVETGDAELAKLRNELLEKAAENSQLKVTVESLQQDAARGRITELLSATQGDGRTTRSKRPGGSLGELERLRKEVEVQREAATQFRQISDDLRSQLSKLTKLQTLKESDIAHRMRQVQQLEASVLSSRLDAKQPEPSSEAVIDIRNTLRTQASQLKTLNDDFRLKQKELEAAEAREMSLRQELYQLRRHGPSGANKDLVQALRSEIALRDGTITQLKDALAALKKHVVETIDSEREKRRDLVVKLRDVKHERDMLQSTLSELEHI